MLLMALDHVRDYFHIDAFTVDPLDPAGNPALFFTRWITHYCAPVFVFLSGISAYLSGLKKTPGEHSLFLFKRGLFLIVAEFTIVTFGWTFNPNFNILVMQVIWAIGASMLAMALISRLPLKGILLLAVCILAGHNLLDYAEARHQGGFTFFQSAMHSGGFAYFPFAPGHGFVVVYPLLPWIGIMALGYCFGAVYRSDFNPQRRRRLLLYTGAGLIVLFVLLRLLNGYGNPQTWQAGSTAMQTLLAFLHVSKYPPSLMFTAMCLGPALLYLAFSESAQGRISSVFQVYGKVPFFYYLLHIYLIHLLAVGLFLVSGYGVQDIPSPGSMFWFRPVDMGFGLPAVYLVWLLVLLLLYRPCKWYAAFKKRSSHVLFRYI